MNCDYIKLGRKITPEEFDEKVKIVGENPIFKGKLFIFSSRDGFMRITMDGIGTDFETYIDNIDSEDDGISIRMSIHPFLSWVQTVFSALLAKQFGQKVYYNEGISEELNVDEVLNHCKDFNSYLSNKSGLRNTTLKRFYNFLYIKDLVKRYPVVKDFI